jgi:hypothetical protein
MVPDSLDNVSQRITPPSSSFHATFDERLLFLAERFPAFSDESPLLAHQVRG